MTPMTLKKYLELLNAKRLPNGTVDASWHAAETQSGRIYVISRITGAHGFVPDYVEYGGYGTKAYQVAAMKRKEEAMKKKKERQAAAAKERRAAGAEAAAVSPPGQGQRLSHIHRLSDLDRIKDVTPDTSGESVVNKLKVLDVDGSIVSPQHQVAEGAEAGAAAGGASNLFPAGW